MRFSIFFPLIVMLFGYAQRTEAVVTINNATRCDGCSDIEIAMAPGSVFTDNYPNRVDWYVYDLRNNVLVKYTNQGGTYYGWQTNPEPDLIQYVNYLSKIYALTNGTLNINEQISLPPAVDDSSASFSNSSGDFASQKMQITLPSPNDRGLDAIQANQASTSNGSCSNSITAGSVYDVIPDNPKRTCVLNYVSNISNWPGSSAALFYLQSTFQIGKIIGGSQVTVQFQVNFADGSRMDVVYSSITQTCSYVPGSAYDSHGNHIPDKKSDVSDRNFDFSGPGNNDDRLRMGLLLAGWGLNSHGGGTGGGGTGSGGFHGWACTSAGEGDNKVYTCTAY